MKSSLIRAASALAVLLTPIWAHALDPEDSTTYVTDVKVDQLDEYTSTTNTADATSQVGIVECKSNLSKNITVTFTTSQQLDQTGGPALEGAYYFSVDSAATAFPDCKTNPGNVCTKVSAPSIAATNVSFTVPFRDLAGVGEAADCDASSDTRELFFRLLIDPNDGTSTDPVAIDYKVNLDLERPIGPTGVTGTATSSQFSVSWTDASETPDEYGLVYSSEAFDEDTPADELGLTPAAIADNDQNQGTVSGLSLSADSELYYGLASRDQAGNYSTATLEGPITVIDTVDFFEAYKGAGGTEEGAFCAVSTSKTAPSPSALTFLLLGLLGLIRRHRRPQENP